MMNTTPERLAVFFEEAVMSSPLAVGIYDLGRRRGVIIPEDQLKEIYRLPKLRLVKDSSMDPERRAIALAARHANPSLQLFNGDEFNTVEYLKAGYDGCIFGGAAAVAPLIHHIVKLFQSGRFTEAREVDQEMKTILYGIYGGNTLSCWLTGLKYLRPRNEGAMLVATLGISTNRGLRR
jgi:4-hydroxy-tetrahydrodipicolinate synthase